MIWQRIKNLWKLSDLKFLTEKQKVELGLPIPVSHVEKPKKLAQIIRKRDPVAEALKQEKKPNYLWIFNTRNLAKNIEYTIAFIVRIII